MTASMWFVKDLSDMLRGVNAANATGASNAQEQSAEYRRGFDDAILSMALAIGINPREVCIRPHENPRRMLNA